MNHNTSLQEKIRIINYVDVMNLNQKVGIIYISISDSNPIDSKVISKMSKNYRNIY